MGDLLLRNFYVFEISKEMGRIIEFKVKNSIDGYYAYHLSREEMIDLIENNNVFTITRSFGWQKYTLGDKLVIFSRGGNEFVRTEGNSTEKDNLGGLPEY